MNISTAIERYKQYMAYQQHLAPSTVQKYHSTLQRFARFVGRVEIEEITVSDLDSFINTTAEARDHAKATTALMVTIVRSFFRYLAKVDLVPKNPAEGLAQPKRDQRLPVYLTEHELKTLLQTPIEHNSAHNYEFDFEHRDTLIVKTLAYTGLRRAELCALNWQDIDFAKGIVTVRNGKGGKDRQVPLLPEIEGELRQLRALMAGKDTDPVFIGLHGKRLSPDAITTMFDRFVKPLIPHKKVTPHVLRATFATLLLKNGGDLFTISRILGHSKLSTTQHYLVADEEQLFDTVRKHPLHSAVSATRW